jgi:16S rRNA (guanine(966)-N(2))-methyltransferase RsmD
MRIIGGSAGGRRLKAPPGATTRPTADRVREAIFSILGPPPPNTSVLDLFAGAGTLGLEALSRGAVRAVLVDRAAPAVRCLRDNITALAVTDRCTVRRADVGAALRRLANSGERFGWVFVDPPYQSNLADATLALLGDGTLLAADPLVIVEHDRRRPPAAACGVLGRHDLRTYGDTSVSFYGRVAP